MAPFERKGLRQHSRATRAKRVGGAMRILVVDDHQIVRRGVTSLLTDQPGFRVCGEAVDGRDALDKVRALEPHAVVMDVSMPNMNGIEAAREISRLFPAVQIVMLSQHDSPEIVRQALDAGARAYVVKSAMSTDLVAALEKIHKEKESAPPSIFGSTRNNIDLQEILQRSAAFETALRESEERFRLTFEQAAVGIAHVAEDGRWLRVNRKLCEILGYSQDELRNLTFQQVTYPPDLEEDLAQLGRLVAREIDHHSIEKRYIRKDGSLVWSNLTRAAVRDADGNLKYFISVVEDISARKRGEATLALHIRQQRALFILADELNRADSFDALYAAAFRAIFSGLDCDRASILLRDAAGVMRFVSSRHLSQAYREAAEGYSPWSQDEISPQPVCIEEVESAKLPDSLRAAMQEEDFRALSFFPLVWNQRLIGRFMVYYDRPHAFDSGEIEFCLTVARQLVFGINRRETDEALMEKASLLDLSSDAIVVRDPADRVTYWNNAAQEIYGFTREEAIGRVTHDLLATQFPEPLERIQETLHRESRWNGKLTHTAKDGSKIVVSSRWCVARDQNGNVAKILETNREITSEGRQPTLRQPSRLGAPDVASDVVSNPRRGSLKARAARPGSD